MPFYEYISHYFGGDPVCTGSFLVFTSSITTFLVSIVCSTFDSMILPSAPLGFLFHPVENNGPSWKRGKGCASVLMTTWSSGKRSLGEKRR